MDKPLTMKFRANILEALSLIASEATAQRSMDFPPEELRLAWEDSYYPLEGEHADQVAIASFTMTELEELRRFNSFIWSLPPEPDAMWHRDNLDRPPWPAIRSHANETLALLTADTSQS